MNRMGMIDDWNTKTSRKRNENLFILFSKEQNDRNGILADSRMETGNEKVVPKHDSKYSHSSMAPINNIPSGCFCLEYPA